MLAVGFIGVLGGVLHCHAAVRQRLAWESPHGRYCARQVLDMAERLYPQIAAEAANQRGTAEYQEWPLTGSQYRHTWNVLYTDNQGTDAAYFVWNADTGQLVEASSGKPPEVLTASLHSLRSEEAVTISARHLQRLGMMGAGNQHWQLAEPPEKHKRAWTMKFVSDREKINITIDANNGALRTARAW